jgi:hypothetical protein
MVGLGFELDDVTKSFTLPGGQLRALEHVSLSVGSGEVRFADRTVGLWEVDAAAPGR